MSDGDECRREKQSIEERCKPLGWDWFAIINRIVGQISGKDHSWQTKQQVQIP